LRSVLSQKFVFRVTRDGAAGDGGTGSRDHGLGRSDFPLLEFPTKPHPQRAGFQASTEERLLSADDIRSLSAPRAGGRWRKREGCGTLASTLGAKPDGAAAARGGPAIFARAGRGREGRLSTGKAAQICDMSRPEFILAAGKMGVPVVQLDEEELSIEENER
jgi:hypothetical protein